MSFEKYARFQKKLLLGLAGKPEMAVTLTLPELETQQALPPSSLPSEFHHPVDTEHNSVGYPIREMVISDGVREWVKVASSVAASANVDTKSMWVLLKSSQSDNILMITTSTGSSIVGYRDPHPKDGSLKLFVRFDQFAESVSRVGDLSYSLKGQKLLFGSPSGIQTMEGSPRVYPENPSSRPLVPVSAPSSGYSLVRGLGRAIREASKFSKPAVDAMGRHAVCVLTRQDGSGFVDVVGMDDVSVYRRGVQAPKIAYDIYLESFPELGRKRLFSDDLGVIHAGCDMVWLSSDDGMILGATSEPVYLPCELDQILSEKHSGVAAFTVDEMAALVGGLSSVRPEGKIGKQYGIKFEFKRNSITFGDPDNPTTVSCASEAGPANMVMDCGLALKACSVAHICAIEFDRNDASKPLIFSGPGVRVAVMPGTPTRKVP